MLEISSELIERYEASFDPARPEAGPVQAKVIGYGEMSTILGFDEPGYEDFVFKRLALFADGDEADAYEKIYVTYNDALTEVGLRITDWGLIRVDSDWGPVLYLTQLKVDPGTVGHKLIHTASQSEALALVEAVLGEIRKVFAHNAELEPGAADGVELGLDAQISNFALPEPGAQPYYFDTSTPLMRIGGHEQIDPELFLRICPSSMTWIVRRFFLDDVLDRYYVLRLVVTDLLANLYKEQKASLVPPALDLANDFFTGMRDDAAFSACDLSPLEKKAVVSYYRQDMPIWWLFLNLRRTERFWRTKIRGLPYRTLLPGRTRRFHIKADRT